MEGRWEFTHMEWYLSNVYYSHPWLRTPPEWLTSNIFTGRRVEIPPSRWSLSAGKKLFSIDMDESYCISYERVIGRE